MTMAWGAIPPEVNTSMLITGAGPFPMLAAVEGWKALAEALAAQAAELTGRLAALCMVWTGQSSDTAIAAAQRMVSWLLTTAEHAEVCAVLAGLQAVSYTQARETTPSLEEIAQNRITTTILMATNVFGINTGEIATLEERYFLMWIQAAAVMDLYEAETEANTRFPETAPMTKILDPGASQTILSGVSKITNAIPKPLQQAAGQAAQMGSSMLTQSMQQATSLFSQMGSSTGSSASLAHDGLGWSDGGYSSMGFFGTDPFSNHPLAGGSGPSTGAGLLQGKSAPGTGGALLPGSGGTSPRTPLMTGLIEPASPAVAPAAAGASTAGSAPPVGAGPVGSAAPVGAGAIGQGGASTKPGLVVPAPLTPESGEQVPQSWGDVDDDW